MITFKFKVLGIRIKSLHSKYRIYPIKVRTAIKAKIAQMRLSERWTTKYKYWKHLITQILSNIMNLLYIKSISASLPNMLKMETYTGKSKRLKMERNILINKFLIGSASWLWLYRIYIRRIFCIVIWNLKISCYLIKMKSKLVILAFQRCSKTPLTWRILLPEPHSTSRPKYAWGKDTTTSPTCGCWGAYSMKCACSKGHLKEIH